MKLTQLTIVGFKSNDDRASELSSPFNGWDPTMSASVCSERKIVTSRSKTFSGRSIYFTATMSTVRMWGSFANNSAAT